MSILSGFLKTKRHRLTDEGYIVQSEWTSASSVEFADGMTAEEKIQDIESNGLGLELTQAKYDELSEEEQKTGTYFINDKGILIKNGVIYSNGELDTTLSIEGKAADAKAVGDAITVRKVNDEADENYGWIQYKDKDGNWVNLEQVFSNDIVLIENGVNAAEIDVVSGSTFGWSTQNAYNASVESTDDYTKFQTGDMTNLSADCIFLSKEKYDLTSLNTISITHESDVTGVISTWHQHLVVCQKRTENTVITPVADLMIVANTDTSLEKSGTKQLDISSLTGEYYIGIAIHGNYTASYANVYDLRITQ